MVVVEAMVVAAATSGGEWRHSATSLILENRAVGRSWRAREVRENVRESGLKVRINVSIAFTRREGRARTRERARDEKAREKAREKERGRESKTKRKRERKRAREGERERGRERVCVNEGWGGESVTSARAEIARGAHGTASEFIFSGRR